MRMLENVLKIHLLIPKQKCVIFKINKILCQTVFLKKKHSFFVQTLLYYKKCKDFLNDKGIVFSYFRETKEISPLFVFLPLGVLAAAKASAKVTS